MTNIKLSPPWVTYYRELKALFANDEQVKVVFDQGTMQISVYVDNGAKAEALTALLNESKEFGGVTVTVTVIPSNKPGDRFTDVFKTAFNGNDILRDVAGANIPLGSFTYVLWDNNVAQFFNDNLGDAYGNQTMLFEDIARDVLKPFAGVYHCTFPISWIDKDPCEWL